MCKYLLSSTHLIHLFTPLWSFDYVILLFLSTAGVRHYVCASTAFIQTRHRSGFVGAESRNIHSHTNSLLYIQCDRQNQRRRRYLLDVVPHGSFAGVRRSFPAQNHISPVCFWVMNSCRWGWRLSLIYTEKTHTLHSLWVTSMHCENSTILNHHIEMCETLWRTHLPRHRNKKQHLAFLQVFWLQKDQQ